MNAVDTNILIYSIDSRDARKRARAVHLIQTLPESETIIPWQVACETAAVLRTMVRSGHFQGDFAQTITSLRDCFPIRVPELSTLDRSVKIHVQLQVSPWDALLIAACADAGVTRLYTEDFQSQSVIDGVQLINPFVQ